MTDRAGRIRAALLAAFPDAAIELADDSHRHAGHAGVRTGPGHAQQVGETHYRLRMVAPAFAGMNRVARQRAVQGLLAAEFAAGLHALSMTLQAPGEG